MLHILVGMKTERVVNEMKIQLHDNKFLKSICAKYEDRYSLDTDTKWMVKKGWKSALLLDYSIQVSKKNCTSSS